MTHLRVAAIVVFKGPVQHCRVRKSLGFQPPHKVAVLLLADKGFLFFSFRALAAAFDGVLVFPPQNKTFSKKGFLWGVTSSAVKQTVLVIIIRSVFGNTGWELFQNFFYRLYRLSPSLKV